MARRTGELNNPIQEHASVPAGTEWEEKWDNHLGVEVEDFITEKLKVAHDNIIDSASMSGLTLILKKKDGSEVTTTVVIADPTYTYGIYIYGLVLNGDYSNIKRGGSDIITQYSSGKTFHLGVALLGYTDTVGNKSNLTNAHDISILFGDKSMTARVVPIPYEKILTDQLGHITALLVEDVKTEIAWIDVTELFTESNTSSENKQISASYSFEAKSGGTTKLFTGSYTLPGNITNEVINISYPGSIVNNTRTALFTTDSNDSNYQLEGYVVKNHSDDYEIIKLEKSLTYTNLVPGLNQFYVKAVNINNSNVSTDYLAVDIICTVGLTEPAVAINNVNDTIANNGVATLYNLTVYSPSGEDNVELKTYLTNSMIVNLSELSDSDLVKQDVITDTSYTLNDKTVYTTSYKKYMEIPGGGNQYLYVKVGNNWYNYLETNASRFSQSPYKQMTVEALDDNLSYYSSANIKLSFDQIKGCNNNVFKTKEYYPKDYNVSDKLEVSDGWIEQDGRTLFRVSAQKNPVFKTPLTVGLLNQFTLEFGIKTYNISDEHEPILTLGNILLRPTQICWDVNKSAEEELNDDTFTSRNSYFQENVETHIVVTFKEKAKIDDDRIYFPNYLDIYKDGVNETNLKSEELNLLRIYINGVIDREFILNDEQLKSLKEATLQINPTTCDADFYLLRIYDSTALNFSQVQKNYCSFLKNKSDKLKFFKANDILGSNGEISFNKARELYNTIVYVYPSGYKKIGGDTHDIGRFPNRAWGYPDNSPAQDKVMKDAHVTLFVNYINKRDNERCGGRITKGQVKGQGSSAARYLIWNVAYTMNKFKDADGKKLKSEFTPYAYLGPDNRFVEGAISKNTYIMPEYEGEEDKYNYEAEKLVGKVNFASSMQSHKPGACKLYDDAFKYAGNIMPKTAATTSTCPGSKKAVHEEPFLYFYWEPENVDNDAVDKIELADVINAGSEVKFMGFQTWGPAKKDKAYFGYSDYTPEYILVEGGENKAPAANFRVPWHALQRANEELTSSTNVAEFKLSDKPTTPYDVDNSWKRLLILDESICYDGTIGALDLDFGATGSSIIKTGDESITYWDIDPNARKSLNKFRAFYDFVYSTDFTIKLAESTDTSTWDTKYKYVVLQSSFNGYSLGKSHKPFDVYRYEEYSSQWVPAGVKYDTDNNVWESYNLQEVTKVNKYDVAIGILKDKFLEEIGNYVNIQDICFHQALIKFLSGTDNRAKNTYFQIVGPVYRDVDGQKVIDPSWTESDIEDSYKIRLMGDDLDTIIATDNNGLQTKPYNLLESSYNSEMTKHWGDSNNIFFYMFDQCFEGDIRTLLGFILLKAFSNSDITSSANYFYNVFFDIQDNKFPAVAYNHQAKIYYENALYIINSKILPFYKNNDVGVPLSQSHGSSVACEKLFMQKRYNFLSTYATVNRGTDNYNFTSSSGGSGVPEARLVLNFSPYQDFYPTYYWDNGSNVHYLGELNPKSTFDSNIYLAEEGKNYEVQFLMKKEGINNALQSMSLYKTLSIVGIQNNTLNADLSHLTLLRMDNDDMDKYDLFSNVEWNPTELNIIEPKAPVLQKLSLRNMNLPPQLNLESFTKLLFVDLTNTNVNYVAFPQSGRFETIILPASITEFRIYNNPGLLPTSQSVVNEETVYTGVNFESIQNLKVVYINANNVGNFDVTNFCKQLMNAPLQQVTLRNLNNLRITEANLSYLLSAEKCQLTGSIVIVDDDDRKTSMSFNTLKQLVDKFGNIRSKTNGLFVDFNESNVTSVKVSDKIVIYRGNEDAYVIPQITGTNVAIIEDASAPSGYRLNLSYFIRTTNNPSATQKVPDSIATLDTITGLVHLVNESSTKGYVFVQVVLLNNNKQTSSTGCEVQFAWTAPAVGDFAYADGSFSASYLPSKTMVGLVYAVKQDRENPDTKGTAYIIGKEYSLDKSVPFGYTGEGSMNYNSLKNNYQDSVTAQLMKIYKENELGITDPYTGYYGDKDSRNISIRTTISTLVVDEISSTKVPNLIDSVNYYFGKEDTAKYIKMVNDNLGQLDTYYRSNDHYTPSILQCLTFDQGGYSISSIEDLKSLINTLNNVEFGSATTPSGFSAGARAKVGSAIIYPYVYSMYLYQPEYTGTLDPQYSKGNWYVPSLLLMQTVIYFRGLSTGNFLDPTDVRQPIDSTVTTSNAIFAKAKSAMTAAGYSNYPSEWNQLCGTTTSSDVNNIVSTIGQFAYTSATTSPTSGTTTVNYTGNFSYQYSGESEYSYGSSLHKQLWNYGAQSYQSDWSTVNVSASYGGQTYAYPGGRNTWRLTPHQGIPFVEYNYQKPQ